MLCNTDLRLDDSSKMERGHILCFLLSLLPEQVGDRDEKKEIDIVLYN